MNRIIAIDPSGTGTTGIFFTNGKNEEFEQFISKNWTEHLVFILNYIQAKQAKCIWFESTNYISLRGKDMTALLKFMGALESLAYTLGSVQTKQVPVHQVKQLKKALLHKKRGMANLIYLAGKGWFYQNQKISVHQLDAYLVYWLILNK